MKNIISILESKWGLFSPHGNALCNKQMSFVSDKAYLNIIFKSEMVMIGDTFASLFGGSILPELQDFYKQYNGCRLFFSSLNIFGIQCHAEDVYEPYDLERENDVIQLSIKDNSFVFFASLGGDYVFAYKKDECSKIYTFKKGEKKIIKTFDGFGFWFSYYFDTLYDEYDHEGRKKHPNAEYKKIPALYHVTYKIF